MKKPRSGSRPPPPSRETGVARPMRAGSAIDLDPRLARVRRLAWVMDRSIPLPGGGRIGLDPLIGLWPGAGDAIGAVVSLFIVYEAARVGLPLRVIGRMIVNILIEALAGTVPLFGDVFDAVWMTNARNVKLLEDHYRPERPSRPPGRLLVSLGVIGLAIVALVVVGAVVVVGALWRFFQSQL